jgi:hypothetical protein
VSDEVEGDRVCFCSSAGEHRRTDEASRVARVLVFPEPEHGPAIGFQGFADPGVSLLVGGDLLVPVPAIGGCPGAVDGASVPEAAIDIDGNPATGENDVRPNQPSSGRPDREVHPVSKPHSIEGLSQGELRSSVAPFVRPHDCPTLLWDPLPGGSASIALLGLVATHHLPSSLGLCR